jgi:hypothetical protein
MEQITNPVLNARKLFFWDIGRSYITVKVPPEKRRWRGPSGKRREKRFHGGSFSGSEEASYQNKEGLRI